MYTLVLTIALYAGGSAAPAVSMDHVKITGNSGSPVASLHACEDAAKLYMDSYKGWNHVFVNAICLRTEIGP